MKNWIALFLCCVLCLSPVSVGLCSIMGKSLLPDEDRESVNEAVDSFHEQTGMRFAVAILGEEDAALMDECGLDGLLEIFVHNMIKPESGILYLIDIATGESYLCAEGDMLPLLTDERKEDACAKVNPIVGAGNIAQAITTMIEIVQAWIPQSIIDEQIEADRAVIEQTDDIIAIVAEHNRALMQISEKRLGTEAEAVAARADLLVAFHEAAQDQIISLLNVQAQIAQMIADISIQ